MGRVNDRIYKLDVNSFHPYIMGNLPLPYKLVRAGEHTTNESLQRFLASGNQFIIKCNLTCNSDSRCISIRKEVSKGVVRTVFPIGTFNATITSLEYEQLLRYGGRVNDIYGYAVYEASVLFRDYINYFYKKRLYFKSVKDKTMDNMSKYFMNSLEGKLAQHVKQTIILNEHSDREEGSHIVIDSDTGEVVIIHVYGGKEWVSTKEKAEGYNVFVSIPSFIRAYTRCILFDDFATIRNAGGHTYYCDTDSIFTDERGKDALSEMGKIDPNILGLYKIEGVSDDLEIKGCKDYIFDKEEHIKGIRKNARYEDGVYKQVYFCKMPAMLQRGISEGVIIVDDFEKRPSRIYHKGFAPSAGGWVKPLVYNGL
jgi:hypothetical protein